MMELEEDLMDIEDLRLELADFFSEDEGTFKLEECFKTLQTFCERFKKTVDVSISSLKLSRLSVSAILTQLIHFRLIFKTLNRN